MSLNRVIITGNLTRDAELKQTAGGTAILKMRLAVNGREKKGDNWVDRVEYVDCTMFGTRADSVARYLSKGSKVGVDGRLRWHEWETSDGSKRQALEVIVDDLELLTPKGSTSAPAPESAPDLEPPADYDSEDIPFN